ncbi:SIR2 family protein [Hyalangium sp.]|uniref:SIR2 family protein n=1 Tax=Hyalangium sp. TaxID=2028555 RepID=UPI002D6153D9|nr:SIR2 family protein [Hyalangium sp.]HYI01143.1 SIR2 family protein [Hyalangium sp.]
MPPSSTTEPTASPSTTLNEILSIQDNASEFARLKAQVHSGRVIPFVGAGLSIPCGFPGWTAFLLEEAKHAGIEAEIQADLSAGKYGEAAQRLEDELHSFAFRRRIATVFGKELLPSGAVKLLPEIAAGSIITTNFDRVIERVFKDASKPLDSVWGARFGAIRNALFTQARYLLKLHGDAYDETERVLTQAEYDQHYGDIQDPLRPLPYALKAIFSSATLLFLGCSLTVDRTIKILGQLSSQPVAPEHYAIVEAPDSQEDFRLRRRALSGLRIVPIWYPRARHHSVEVLLRALCSPTP